MTGRVRQAAAVLVTRDTGDGVEVLLVQRSPDMRFFGGYWVFPGGNVSHVDRDGTEGDADLVFRRCAIRELFEEMDLLATTLGVPFTADRKTRVRERVEREPAHWNELFGSYGGDLARLQPVCCLTTPEFFPTRFETRFLMVPLHEEESPRISSAELVKEGFFAPARAVELWQRGEMEIAPPVLYLLRLLAEHGPGALPAVATAAADGFDRGELHPAWFAPAAFVAPLRTPTLPPATTTNTVVMGHRELYVIDPATPDPDELQRLFRALDGFTAAGARLRAVLLTHHHADHVGAVNAVSHRYQVPVRAHPLTYPRIATGYLPGEPLNDGDRIHLGESPAGDTDWELRVIHTPGHAVDHLCFLDSRYGTAVAGDMLSTVSTILIDPPEGHMRTYLQSLERMLGLGIRTLIPAHGPPCRDGPALIREFLAHRAERERQVLDALGGEPRSVEAMLPAVYDDVPEQALPFAARSMLAVLIKLAEDGRCEETPRGWRRIPAAA